MGYAMVDLFFIRVRFGIRFADAFGNHFRETFCMASELAIFTLHSRGVLKELPTKCTPQNGVELLLDKFVAVLLLNFFFSLSYSTFPAKACIESSLSSVFLRFSGSATVFIAEIETY